MKIYKISVFILIILIFSVGFAFAEDVKQATSLDDANGEVISDVTVKSYDDLNTALHRFKYEFNSRL